MLHCSRRFGDKTENTGRKLRNPYFGGKNHLPQRSPEDKHVSLPEDLYYGCRRMARTKSASIERMKTVNSMSSKTNETTMKQWNNKNHWNRWNLFRCSLLFPTQVRFGGFAENVQLAKALVTEVLEGWLWCDLVILFISNLNKVSQGVQLFKSEHEVMKNAWFEVEIERSLQKLPRRWR